MQQPHERQILVSFGNRYVVFGSSSNLPDRRQLGPEDVKQIDVRVADEREGIERRIVDSLKVYGFEVQVELGAEFGEIRISDQNGSSALVEIKTGDRDFAGLNLSQVWAELSPAAERGERREIWAFNLERLGLGIVWSEGPSAPRFEQLSVLNVWEFNPDGSVFQRQDIVERLDDWDRRIEAVYADAEAWALEDKLTASKNRTVQMSEELMQRFAVSDRDLPILDLASDSKPVISMVPVGLWLIGFNGQINIITRSGTYKLGDQARFPASPDWVLINPKDRTVKPWSHNEFRSILGLVSAHE